MIKKLTFVFMLLMAFQSGIAQELYSKAFGNPTATPVVFLHGGPGYNCAVFEVTTAQALADQGFYVIVYDRPGEGRSVDTNAKFTFDQTFEDLNSILKKYNIKEANLIGHSFGGIVATLYARKHPHNVKSIALVSAPVALQETFKTILRSSRKIYTEKGDKANLNYIDMIEKMDPKSVEYFAYTFGHAMQNGFYSPKKMTNEALEIYAEAAKDPAFAYAKQMANEPPQGFLLNEDYTSINLTKTLQELVGSKTRIFGLYGRDDGLYSPEQVAALGNIIGKDNLRYWENASHNVFIDQQQLFLTFFKTMLNP